MAVRHEGREGPEEAVLRSWPTPEMALRHHIAQQAQGTGRARAGQGWGGRGAAGRAGPGSAHVLYPLISGRTFGTFLFLFRFLLVDFKEKETPTSCPTSLRIHWLFLSVRRRDKAPTIANGKGRRLLCGCPGPPAVTTAVWAWDRGAAHRLPRSCGSPARQRARGSHAPHAVPGTAPRLHRASPMSLPKLTVRLGPLPFYRQQQVLHLCHTRVRASSTPAPSEGVQEAHRARRYVRSVHLSVVCLWCRI